MKLLVRSALAVVAAMTLSGCMILMAPMLLWHGSHLKKKNHHGPDTPQDDEVCECCHPAEPTEPQATSMDPGESGEAQGEPRKEAPPHHRP
jgi:hypothetical protein